MGKASGGQAPFWQHLQYADAQLWKHVSIDLLISTLLCNYMNRVESFVVNHEVTRKKILNNS